MPQVLLLRVRAAAMVRLRWRVCLLRPHHRRAACQRQRLGDKRDGCRRRLFLLLLVLSLLL